MSKPGESQVVPVEIIERRIYLIRGQKVMLDSDLAFLYQVLTKNLNKAIKRNSERFPEDFMFQLTQKEIDSLRFQIGTSKAAETESSRFQIGTLKKGRDELAEKKAETLRLQSATSNAGRGGRRYLPFVFTELGVAMLSSVLNSERAVQMNILIMRAFVKIRELLASNKDLAVRVEKLEANHKQHGRAISLIVREIDELKSLPEPKNKRIM